MKVAKVKKLGDDRHIKCSEVKLGLISGTTSAPIFFKTLALNLILIGILM